MHVFKNNEVYPACPTCFKEMRKLMDEDALPPRFIWRCDDCLCEIGTFIRYPITLKKYEELISWNLDSQRKKRHPLESF